MRQAVCEDAHDVGLPFSYIVRISSGVNTREKMPNSSIRPFNERMSLSLATPGRDQFHYLESWLLPTVGLRVSVFHFNPGYERDQDYYLDVGRFTQAGHVWTSEDHYLDLVVRTGRDVALTDADELLIAVHQGLLAPELAERAVQTAVRAVDGLASHDYHLEHWLADLEMTLTWHGA